MSPTELTLKMLRSDGWTAQVVERWNPHAKVRQDLFGFIDIVAFKPSEGVLGVQATSYANISARKNKILNSAKAKDWIQCAGLYVIGWRKKARLPGGRELWEPTLYPFSISDWENEH